MNADNSFAELIGPLRHGDDRAAAEVFNRYAQRLIALARSRLDPGTRQKVDPEDVVQSVYRSFFTRYADGQFDVRDWDNLWSMLTVMTVRKCVNRVEFFRAACRDVQREVAAQTASDETTVGRAHEGVSAEPTPDEAAALTDTVEQLMRGLENERERQILTLSLQGYSAAEVSGRVGRAERTVRRVLERVRERLKRMREEPSAP